MLLGRGWDWRDAGVVFRAEDGSSGGPGAASDPDGEPFDEARARATILNLRQFEKDAKRLQRELDALKKEQEERGAAEMTDVQKAEKKAADAQAALDALTSKHKTAAIHGAVRLAAVAAGFVDPEDAISLADLSSVEMTEEDAVVGVKEAIAKLAKAKPHLVGSQRPQAPDLNSGGGGSPRAATPEELAAKRRATDTVYTPF